MNKIFIIILTIILILSLMIYIVCHLHHTEIMINVTECYFVYNEDICYSFIQKYGNNILDYCDSENKYYDVTNVEYICKDVNVFRPKLYWE